MSADRKPSTDHKSPFRILLLFGTRPEAIKLAPVLEALRCAPRTFRVTACATGQHRELLDQASSSLALRPEIQLDLMRPGQGLNDLAARSFAALDGVVTEAAPDWVVVQGDTTTAMVGAWVAFHRGVRVAHVEAGLRTGDLAQPFPEEANRRAIDMLAQALFAPTPHARRLLEAEGVPAERIHVTGNTVVDALRSIAASLPAEAAEAVGAGRSVLVTVHRRESFGEPLARILAALRDLADRFPDVRWLLPVHPNPNVGTAVYEGLAGLPNVELHPPFDYPELVRRLRGVDLVLTDSGGLQEEAPVFGKPVLVMRDKTERPEGVIAGVARLVGTRHEVIVDEVARLLDDEEHRRRMTSAVNPYGDGRAALRIAAVLAGEPYTPFVAEVAAEAVR